VGGEATMLLEDLFDVKDIDEGGKKFDNISRISAKSQTYDLELTLDVNVEIYPIKVRAVLCCAPNIPFSSACACGCNLAPCLYVTSPIICPSPPTVQTDERFSLALCSNLRKDGGLDEGVFDQSGAPSLHTRNLHPCILIFPSPPAS